MSIFKITETKQSNINSIDVENLQAGDFGKYNTDHFAIIDYINGEWQNFEVKPFASISLSPFTSALHYGQTIFEGMKAYRLANDSIATFRIIDHAKRINISAQRLNMPILPTEFFIEAVETVLKLDEKWTPKNEGSAMYVRPFMFASDACLIAKASNSYKFMVVCCPVASYYNKPLRVSVETNFTRAAIGGAGNAKMGGNYAASFVAAKEAMEKGFDQIIWTDANEHSYIQEMGASNIMFLINDILYTPDLEDKTILAGITRKSVLELLHKQGKKVIEKKIHIDELINAANKGILQEAFAVGTAVTANPIGLIKYKELELKPSDETFKVTKKIIHDLNQIRYGKTKDDFGWMKTI